MSRQQTMEDGSRHTGGEDARRRLLAGAPVTERRLDLAGVSTAVLEGGDGPPVVLLHGQGGWSGMWLPVVGELVATHRVVAPDLPGLGASQVPGGPPDAAGVLAWLGELIQRTCLSPPALVGASLGASVAARFVIAHPDRVSRLVLVDAGSLGRFRPAPGVVLAMIRFIARPNERTHRGFLRQVAVDPARVRALMGDRWEVSQAYNLDRARTPSVRAANRRLLRELGTKPIPPQELARIAVPTSLIWGRHDRVMRLGIAERASARYGWPLHVVEDAGHFTLEQPEASLAALRVALGNRT
ncbi:MAG TPA: alpha/beta fold hydrolase [Actinomycetota bacterium]|jgi:pimeloyl-ACP methyl ester carboxylesterase|nr:alpha/beta fold hydrolase [Actinomycetota bacterium]